MTDLATGQTVWSKVTVNWQSPIKTRPKAEPKTQCKDLTKDRTKDPTKARPKTRFRERHSLPRLGVAVFSQDTFRSMPIRSGHIDLNIWSGVYVNIWQELRNSKTDPDIRDEQQLSNMIVIISLAVDVQTSNVCEWYIDARLTQERTWRYQHGIPRIPIT